MRDPKDFDGEPLRWVARGIALFILAAAASGVIAKRALPVAILSSQPAAAEILTR